MFPPCSLLPGSVPTLAIGWVQVLVPKGQPPRELTLMNTPNTSATSVLVPAVSNSHLLTSPGGPPRAGYRSGPGSYEITAFAFIPICMTPFVHPLRVESISPILWVSCTQVLMTFKAECSGGSSSQCQTFRLGVLTWAKNSHFYGRTYALYLFSNLWITYVGVMRFDYIVSALPLPSWWVSSTCLWI